MKYLFAALLCAFIAVSFTRHKCEHVFVEVEKEAIKIEQPSLSIGGVIGQWPSGVQEGKDLICVKCFHIQKQIVDYGKPEHCTLVWPQSSFMNAGPYYDTLFTRSVGGWLKIDSSFIIHSK